MWSCVARVAIDVGSYRPTKHEKAIASMPTWQALKNSNSGSSQIANVGA